MKMNLIQPRRVEKMKSGAFQNVFLEIIVFDLMNYFELSMT